MKVCYESYKSRYINIPGSLYSPGDGTIEPSGYCAAMSRYSTNKGAKVYYVSIVYELIN